MPTPISPLHLTEENLRGFVPVPLDRLDFLYYGAFVRYKDRNNQAYYGGYINKVKYAETGMILSLSETDDGLSEVYDVDVGLLVQMWKKIDYAYFEILELQRRVLEPMLARIENLEAALKNTPRD